MKKNFMIVLQYDGSRYGGWQKQGSGKDTIQGKLEAVLSRVSGRPIEVHGSGRTDAGVHALGQMANFILSDRELDRIRTEMGRDGEEGSLLKDCLNRYLPEDIAVVGIRPVGERFHSRLSAVRKTYRYCIETAEKKDVFNRKYVYGLGRELDVEAMRQGAERLTGTHDYRAFCSLKKIKKSTVRTIYSLSVAREGTQVILTCTGSGFLHHMVRILAGTLIEAGLGKRSPDEVEETLLSRDRERAGFTAPPEGLFLVCVEYGE